MLSNPQYLIYISNALQIELVLTINFGYHGIYTGSCDYPVDPANRTLFLFELNNGQYVNGRYPEGTEAKFECDLGFENNRVIFHPTVCQANGNWIPTARCEGSRSTVLN